MNSNKLLRENRRVLAGWLSWLERHPVEEKGAGLIPGQGTHLGRGFDPCQGAHGSNRLMLLSHISVSLLFPPSSLSKINKHILG